MREKGKKRGENIGKAIPFVHLLVCQCFQQFDESHSIIQVLLQDLHLVWCALQLLIHPVGERLLLHIYPFCVCGICALLTTLLCWGGGHGQLAGKEVCVGNPLCTMYALVCNNLASLIGHVLSLCGEYHFTTVA